MRSDETKLEMHELYTLKPSPQSNYWKINSDT